MTREGAVLVTGATGFIGREIVRRLLGAGRRVIALARSRDGMPAVDRVDASVGGRPDGARLAVVEHELGVRPFGSDDRAWLRAVVETVIHAAGDTRFFPTDRDGFQAMHVDAPVALLEALAGGRLRRFAHVSTAYVCGDRSGVVFEHDGDVGQAFHNPYERVKLDAELALTRAATARGVDLRVLRPAIVVGAAPITAGGTPSNLFFDVLRLLALATQHYGTARLRGLRIPGAPAAALNLVPVEYVADAVVALAESPAVCGGTYHLVVPSPPAQSTILEWVAPIVGLDAARIVPASDIDGDASPIEAQLLRMLGAYGAYLAQDVRFDDRHARRALAIAGLGPVSLDAEAIARLVHHATGTAGALS